VLRSLLRDCRLEGLRSSGAGGFWKRSEGSGLELRTETPSAVWDSQELHR